MVQPCLMVEHGANLLGLGGLVPADRRLWSGCSLTGGTWSILGQICAGEEGKGNGVLNEEVKNKWQRVIWIVKHCRILSCSHVFGAGNRCDLRWKYIWAFELPLVEMVILDVLIAVFSGCIPGPLSQAVQHPVLLWHWSHVIARSS